jgi:hypothetical protein
MRGRFIGWASLRVPKREECWLAHRPRPWSPHSRCQAGAFVACASDAAPAHTAPQESRRQRRRCRLDEHAWQAPTSVRVLHPRHGRAAARSAARDRDRPAPVARRRRRQGSSSAPTANWDHLPPSERRCRRRRARRVRPPAVSRMHRRAAMWVRGFRGSASRWRQSWRASSASAMGSTQTTRQCWRSTATLSAASSAGELDAELGLHRP